uniref:C-type lectin domain-containing protein n=1 Tax=Myripristis murdjan TaxID=586833 RepID=A0A667W8P6_9TELE
MLSSYLQQPDHLYLLVNNRQLQTKIIVRLFLWILVEGHKTWSDAQSHCRQSYTDLASIRNLTENEEIRGLISDFSWIGLFKDGWKWSDGSALSFSKWDNSQPSGGDKHCATSHLGKWRTDLCSDRFYFACYSGK